MVHLISSYKQYSTVHGKKGTDHQELLALIFKENLSTTFIRNIENSKENIYVDMRA